MLSIQEAKNNLKWVQRSSKEDELVSGDSLVGALHWASLWGSLATAESADGSWTFKRVGFIHQRITVREIGSEVDLYVAELGWGGEATMVLPEGIFTWTPNKWHKEWTLQDKVGIEVMTIEVTGFFNSGGNVIIGQSFLPAQKLSLLALLGWYLIMNVLADDTTSAGAVIATM